MSAYQRFLPRDGTRTRAHLIAEAAEAAEVQAHQGARTAEALLKLAEAEHPDVELQQSSAEVQQRLTPGFHELQQSQQLQQRPASTIAEMHDGDIVTNTVPLATDLHRATSWPVIPTEWSSGVARLATMAPPRTYPANTWQQLVTDAERFLEEWAQQAVALGWPAWELFGCHRRAPWGRIQGMGLVLLLHGDPLAALTATEAVIRRPSGAHQTWRRKTADPLPAVERCLVWELG
jgi:hypothetical protein